MKQAITTHEQFTFATGDVTSYIETTNRALAENHHVEFQRTFKKFEKSLTSMELDILVVKWLQEKEKQRSFKVFIGLYRNGEKSAQICVRNTAGFFQHEPNEISQNVSGLYMLYL